AGQIRHRFPTKTTYLAIRKNRFQTIADTRSELAILRRQQDQPPAILPFRPDPPLLIQRHRVTHHILAIDRLHRNHGNLRLRLLIHLLAKSVQPRLCSRIQNPRPPFHSEKLYRSARHERLGATTRLSNELPSNELSSGGW